MPWLGHLYVDGHVEISREHTFPCVPAPTEVRVHQFDASVRILSENRRSGPRDIVSSAMEGLDESTINRLPSIHNIQKRVGAQKRRAQNIRPIPHNREEIEIPDDLQQTLTNPVEQFLLHDSGADDPLR